MVLPRDPVRIEKVISSYLVGGQLASVGELGTTLRLSQSVPQPPAPADEPVTLFDPGDIKLFIKDLDASPQCRELGGYLRGATLTAWFEAANLTGNDGVVALQPNKILDRVKFGGVGPKMVGSVVFRNDSGEDWMMGAAEWEGTRIVFRFPHTDGKGHLMEATSVGSDFPRQFQYGVVVRVTISLP